MNFPSFVFKNALRNRRRTFLTVSSIAVSLGMIMILQTMLLLITQPPALADAPPRLVVRHRTALTLSLPMNYERKLHTLDGVAATVPMVWFGGVYKDDSFQNMFPRFAVNPDTFFDVFIDFFPTKPEYLDAFRRERTACLVGIQLVEKFGFKVGDRITIRGDIYPIDLEFTVRGIMDGPKFAKPDFLIFNKKYLDEAMGQTQRSGTFFVLAKNNEVVPQLLPQIEAMFRNSDAEVKAETEKEFQQSFVEMLGNIKQLIGSIIAVVVFAVVLIAASTMAMAIRERTREIAVLKTIGFSRGRVLGLVVSEGMLVSVAGGLIGVGGTWLLLPNPRWFMSVGAGIGAAGLVGLLLLLVALVLPDHPVNRSKYHPLVWLQHLVNTVGPWLTLVVGLFAAASTFGSMPPQDWYAFSNGIIPFMVVLPETLMLGIGLTLLIGVCSSVLPAWNAARVKVIEGLRTLG